MSPSTESEPGRSRKRSLSVAESSTGSSQLTNSRTNEISSILNPSQQPTPRDSNIDPSLERASPTSSSLTKAERRALIELKKQQMREEMAAMEAELADLKDDD